MMNGRGIRTLCLSTLLLWAAGSVTALAGMPAPLPSNWTKDNTPDWARTASPGENGFADARLQAISFFVVCLLLCAWGVQGLWSVLRRDLTWLPVLTFRRSLSLVVLWGLLFIIVLTMISGARELMTPGAWRKQGWTYKLADQTTKPDARVERRQALQQLRQALWQYAATHDGRFPTADDPALEAALWDIPAGQGLKFLLVPQRRAEEAGRLLVYEPELEPERQVLLTNGFLGTMSTEEIQRALAADPANQTSHAQEESADGSSR